MNGENLKKTISKQKEILKLLKLLSKNKEYNKQAKYDIFKHEICKSYNLQYNLSEEFDCNEIYLQLTNIVKSNMSFYNPDNLNVMYDFTLLGHNLNMEFFLYIDIENVVIK